MPPVLLIDISSQSGASGGPVFLDDDGRRIAVLFGAIRIGSVNNALDTAIPSSRVVRFLRKHLPAP